MASAAVTVTERQDKIDASGLQYTPVGDIASIVDACRRTFVAGRMRRVSFRKRMLQGVIRMVSENGTRIAEAIYKDLRRPIFESVLCEVAGVVGEAKFALEHIDEWTTNKSVGTPLTQKPGSSEVQCDPYGVVLLIGPWNFPISLLLQALVTALAAGNVVVIKPSEVAANCAVLMGELLPKYLDPDVVKVVQGAVPQVSELLAQDVDYIMYTGGGRVGRIVMEAAAKTLTPVTLELGGKSPCIVDGTVDMPTAARRILSGKLLNCGQVCIAPDYILVLEDQMDALVKAMKDTLTEWHGDNPQNSKDLGRIIDATHFDRVVSLLKSHKGKIAYGGATDRSDLYIQPTILTDVDMKSEIMREEIFGPLLPVIPVKSVEEAITFVNSRPKPLALYVFSKTSSVQKKVTRATTSGGVCVNDTLFHIANPYLPFGGVGPSGMGAYHGEHGFQTFSHSKAILTKPTWLDPSLRYPPYTEGKLKILSIVLGGLPTIPRPILLGLLGLGVFALVKAKL